MYAVGRGVERDFGESVRWYRKAAAQGNVKSQYNLGYSYEHGEGVPRDLGLAVKWYRKAAAEGHEKSQRALRRLDD